VCSDESSHTVIYRMNLSRPRVRSHLPLFIFNIEHVLYARDVVPCQRVSHYIATRDQGSLLIVILTYETRACGSSQGLRDAG
jgi:hypothetical protein